MRTRPVLARVWAFVAAAVSAVLMATASVAAPAVFTIGGERFAHEDIIDARAQPDLSGVPVILITFEPPAAARIQQLTAARIGQTLPFVLDGRTLVEPLIQEAIPGDSIQLSGQFAYQEAQEIALAISGKPPLPESLEE